VLMKILVTGSSGTIGTELMQKLLDKGFDVSGIDIANNKWSRALDARTIIRDLREKFDLDDSFDLVIHLAANARVHKLVKNPDLARDNILMTYNVLEFMRKKGIKRIIFAGSREVYGSANAGSVREDSPKVSESSYTASKIASEALVEAYQLCYGIDFVIARFSNVYGKYDDKDRVVPLFILNAMKGKDLVVFGEEKTLDFTHVDDAVKGVLLVIAKFNSVKNNVFNIASGKGVALAYVANRIIDYFKKGNLVFDSNRTGEIMRYVADISKAKKMLGYAPEIGIDEGITRTIEWYKSNLYKSVS